MDKYQKLLERKKAAEEKLKKALLRLTGATEGEGYFAEHENAEAELANQEIDLYRVLIGDYESQIEELKKQKGEGR